VGDARSTYLNGEISYLNDTAAAIGIKKDVSAKLAARLMLQHAADLKGAEKA